MCGSLTQRDLHTFFVSHLVSLTTQKLTRRYKRRRSTSNLHIIHHVGRALFGWWRSFSLRAKEARAENTNDENNAREEEEEDFEREKSGRARRKAGPRRGKAPDEEDECDDDDIPQ